MKAIILAGGKGTRLRPYTHVFPKPLAPVGERPILAILVERLKRCGVHDLVFCVSHMAELLMAYFGDGEKYGVSIRYSHEETPLGTIGPLKLIRDLPENFLLMNGDLLTDIDFRELYHHHCAQGALATVGTYKRQVYIDFGVMEVREGRVTGFVEKPSYDYNVSMGVYAFKREVLDFVPPDQPFGFDRLMLKLLEENQKIAVYRHNGYWLDIGRREDFEKANDDIMAGRLQA